jgi:hypothetical protein
MLPVMDPVILVSWQNAWAKVSQMAKIANISFFMKCDLNEGDWSIPNWITC